jgi:asparagine synthase (glutamine-hydrolysing)
MFGLAIYDTKAHILILARDRLRIKPVFYAPGEDCLAFASEIWALLAVPGIDLRPDRQSVYDFAALLFIPAPETFYTGIRALQRGIRALQPGEMLEAWLVAAENGHVSGQASQICIGECDSRRFSLDDHAIRLCPGYG